MEILWRYFVEKSKCNFIEISEEDGNKLDYPKAVFVMEAKDYGVVVTIYSTDIKIDEHYDDFNKRKRKDFKKYLTIVGEI